MASPDAAFVFMPSTVVALGLAEDELEIVIGALNVVLRAVEEVRSGRPGARLLFNTEWCAVWCWAGGLEVDQVRRAL